MKNLLLHTVTVFALLVAASFAHGAQITKTNNANSLNLGSSWNGSVAPGAADVAFWTGSVSLSNSAPLGADLSWLGISTYLTSGLVTIGGSNTLTLGKSGIVMAAGNDLTVNPTTLSLGVGRQLWSIGAGRTLTVNPTNFTRGAGATLNLTGTVATSTITNTNDIIGPWASIGGSYSTRYATVSGTNIVAYTGTAAATAGAVTDTSGTANYDVTATSGTFGPNASVNTLRFASASGSTISGTLTANGLMAATNGSSQNIYLNGDITIGSTNELVITTAAGYLYLNGVIKNSGTNASKLVIESQGGSAVILSGSNTFTGGVGASLGGAHLYLNNSNALGIGGALEIQSQTGNSEIIFNPKVGEFVANYANEIKFNLDNIPLTTAGLSTRTANSTVTLNHITGNGGTGYLHFRIGGNSTLVLAEGIETTGFAPGIRLMAGTNRGTIEFQKGIASTGAIDFYTSSAGMNALFSTAVTQANSITNSNAFANTFGVTHATGTSTFSGSTVALGTNTGTNALNLASKTSGARANFSGTVSGSGDLRINDTYTRVGVTTDVVANNGTVQLSQSTGNTYTGTTTVFAGTLLISNTAGSATGTGNVSIQGGATLAGTGIIAPGSSNGLTVLSTGIIAPGDGGIGELTIDGGSTSGTAATFSSGAVFAFDLNATTLESDRLILTNGTDGDFAFGGNTINFNILTGTIADGQQYILFSGTSATQFAGLTTVGGYITAGLSIGTGLPGDFGADSNLQIVGNDIVLNAVAVPEPGAMALLAFSLTTALVLRRRRD